MKQPRIPINHVAGLQESYFRRLCRVPKIIVPKGAYEAWEASDRSADIISFVASDDMDRVQWLMPPPWPEQLRSRPSTMSLRSFRKLVKR